MFPSLIFIYNHVVINLLDSVVPLVALSLLVFLLLLTWLSVQQSTKDHLCVIPGGGGGWCECRNCRATPRNKTYKAKVISFSLRASGLLTQPTPELHPPPVDTNRQTKSPFFFPTPPNHPRRLHGHNRDHRWDGCVSTPTHTPDTSFPAPSHPGPSPAHPPSPVTQ